MFTQLLCATIYNLSNETVICLFTIFLFLQRISSNNDAFFNRNASSHKTDWISTCYCLLCHACLYTYQQNSLMKVLEIERSLIRLLENSIATLLLFVYCVHIVAFLLTCLWPFPAYAFMSLLVYLKTSSLHLLLV